MQSQSACVGCRAIQSLSGCDRMLGSCTLRLTRRSAGPGTPSCRAGTSTCSATPTATAPTRPPSRTRWVPAGSECTQRLAGCWGPQCSPSATDCLSSKLPSGGCLGASAACARCSRWWPQVALKRAAGHSHILALDIGAGSGLLSMMATRCGASSCARGASLSNKAQQAPVGLTSCQVTASPPEEHATGRGRTRWWRRR